MHPGVGRPHAVGRSWLQQEFARRRVPMRKLLRVDVPKQVHGPLRVGQAQRNHGLLHAQWAGLWHRDVPERLQLAHHLLAHRGPNAAHNVHAFEFAQIFEANSVTQSQAHIQPKRQSHSQAHAQPERLPDPPPVEEPHSQALAQPERLPDPPSVEEPHGLTDSSPHGLTDAPPVEEPHGLTDSSPHGLTDAPPYSEPDAQAHVSPYGLTVAPPYGEPHKQAHVSPHYSALGQADRVARAAHAHHVPDPSPFDVQHLLLFVRPADVLGVIACSLGDDWRQQRRRRERGRGQWQE
jgi:hypothetical protein